MKEANPESRALRYEAAMHLRRTENIRRALLWAKKHPEELQSRIEEFDGNLTQMTTLSETIETLNPNLYPNLIKLAEDFWFSDLYPISKIVQTHWEWQENNPHRWVIESIPSAFWLVNRKIISGEWTFPTTITDNPGKLASGLLIEGYGLWVKYFVAPIVQEPDLDRRFLLAFEEVLFMHRPDSKLLKDVKDWMREETVFSPFITLHLQE